MNMRLVGAAVVALLAMAAVPAAAQDPAQTGTPAKHRIAGSYYWQKITPPETKPAEELTPKHRLTGSYYWQQGKPPEQKPEPKPEPKTDAKPATAASLAGRWSVNVETANGPMQSSLDVKADPKDVKKITGTIASQMGEAAFEGEVVLGKLTLWFTMSANGSEISITFTGTMQKDGSLAGTFTFGQGEMPWSAVREKK